MSILGFGVGVGFRPPRAAVASPAFPSTGLVAYWGFDDSLTDSVGSKVLTGIASATTYVTAKLGTKALQIDAAGDFETSDATVLGYLGGACSLQLWVKSATIDGQTFIDAQGGILLGYSGGTLSLTYDREGVAGVASGSVSLSDNTWAHIVVTSDGGTNPPKLYCNNSLIGTGDQAAAIGPSATIFMYGAAVSVALVVDAGAIWNVELDATKVSALWNSGDGNSPA